MFNRLHDPHPRIMNYQEIRQLFMKYMDYVSLQEGDFFLDVPDLSEEEHEELEKLANEIIMDAMEDDNNA